MRKEDLDIVELIIKELPKETEVQERIKLYMQTHKSNCNNFIYEKYEKETTFFNTILKALMLDLSAEIIRVLEKENEVKKNEPINI